uniref:Fetuin B n=1 Tax=Acanthochromis polyacanthus TaxID=80966 RepID=A0A3Q1EAE6_9TELE
MKSWVLLSVLLAVGCVRGAPVDQHSVEQGSCEDASAKGAAELALTKINKDRSEGYIFSLHRLSNVHLAKHGETGVVFYLTLDVVETNCSVLSKKDSKDCEVRPTESTPVYGQCKATIYINKVNRVVRLYKYNCVVRPGINNTFFSLNPPQVSRRTAYSWMHTTIQKFGLFLCSLVSQWFFLFFSSQHKGFCQASLFYSPSGEPEVSVDCEIYEPEAAEREKELHLLDGSIDHSHNDTHPHSQAHDLAHAADQTHSHDHVHDHTKSSPHKHAHDHSHDHGHGHDHVHTHHAKAHNHSGDFPNQHHNYKHADGVHTHEHDHELALDHDHKHAHLHEHEHHHHHHEHTHETTAHDHPEGMVRTLPPMDQPMTLPAFPDVPVTGPEGGVTLPLKPDPQIPNMTEPTIQAFPTAVSAQCAPPPKGEKLVEKLFEEDPMFKAAA